MLKIVTLENQLLPDYLYRLGYSRKLKKYWGTYYLDGVEVFNDRAVFYPSMSDHTKKLLKLLNTYDEIVSANHKGVSSMWLYLNPEKLQTSTHDILTKELLSNIIEETFAIDVETNIAISYTVRSYYLDSMGSLSKKNTSNSIADAIKNLNGQELIDYSLNNYSNIIALQGTQSFGPYLGSDILIKYIPCGVSDNDFSFKIDSVIKIPVTKSERGYSEDNGFYTLNYLEEVVTLTGTAKRISQIDENSAIVTAIFNSIKSSEAATLLNYVSNDNAFSFVKAEVTDDIFYRNRLRVSAYELLDTKAAITLFTGCLDQGYSLKKKKWWEDLIVIIIVVVAIIMAPETNGASLAYAAMALQVVAYIAAQNGYYSLAKTASKVGQILSIIAIIYMGINFANASKIAAEEAERQAVITATASAMADLGEVMTSELYNEIITKMVVEVTSDQIFSQMVNLVTNSLTGSANAIMNTTIKAINMYTKNEIQDVNAKIEELKQQELEWQTSKINANLDNKWWLNVNPLTYFVKIPASPLERISAKYAYDDQYAPTILNIQNNNVGGIGIARGDNYTSKTGILSLEDWRNMNHTYIT